MPFITYFIIYFAIKKMHVINVVIYKYKLLWHLTDCHLIIAKNIAFEPSLIYKAKKQKIWNVVLGSMTGNGATM